MSGNTQQAPQHLSHEDSLLSTDSYIPEKKPCEKCTQKEAYKAYKKTLRPGYDNAKNLWKCMTAFRIPVEYEPSHVGQGLVSIAIPSNLRGEVMAEKYCGGRKYYVKVHFESSPTQRSTQSDLWVNVPSGENTFITTVINIRDLEMVHNALLKVKQQRGEL